MAARPSPPSAAPPRFDDALGHGASDRRIDILRGIALTGSISQAAREAGVSYKAAWQAIDTLTNLAGVPLVQRAVGGAGGGGALLTAQGGHLLALAEALDAARREVHARWIASNADAAARTDATMARLAVRTSMRNQWPATIDALVARGRAVQVHLRFGADAVVAARITQESAELLGLRTGMAVIALCKATSVRVGPAGDASAGAANLLCGSVTRVRRDHDGDADADARDEVTLRIGGGIQLVGFADRGVALRVRQRASVMLDAASVVVALPG